MRPTTEEERAVQEILRSKMAAKLAMFPPEFVMGHALVPGIGSHLRKIEQVFVQTRVQAPAGSWSCYPRSRENASRGNQAGYARGPFPAPLLPVRLRAFPT